MRSLLFCALAVLCLVSECVGKKGFGPGEQEWDYVNVRPSAKMFWWLYYTTANVKSFYDRPLVIWLQGGPGRSSTLYGNFMELGPLDKDLKPRNHTWVKDYNVLFIDNPVGTGFSYASDNNGFAKTNAQVASDLVQCMRGFYKKLPKFVNVPTYIFTQSYGGKMGAEFALVWHQAEKAKTIKSNLRGVALGNAWISPMDSVMTWAPFLFSTGMVDHEGAKAIDAEALKTQKNVDNGQWREATKQWVQTEYEIFKQTNNIDFYNILAKTKARSLSKQDMLSMDEETFHQQLIAPQVSDHHLMNVLVKNALGLNTTHGAQAGGVFRSLDGDFMKPVIRQVELLLQQTDLKVFVYTGHMDLIVDTPGTVLWVYKLKWNGIDDWKEATRHAIVADQIIEGYVKTYDNFSMYWVNRAGHMVPKDNPAAMKIILYDMMDKKD